MPICFSLSAQTAILLEALRHCPFYLISSIKGRGLQPFKCPLYYILVSIKIKYDEKDMEHKWNSWPWKYQKGFWKRCWLNFTYFSLIKKIHLENVDNLVSLRNHGNIVYLEVNRVFDKVFRDIHVDGLRHIHYGLIGLDRGLAY